MFQFIAGTGCVYYYGVFSVLKQALVKAAVIPWELWEAVKI